jgi:hypothetical protein
MIVLDLEAARSVQRSRARLRARAKLVITGVGLVLAWSLMLAAGRLEAVGPASSRAAVPLAAR